MLNNLEQGQLDGTFAALDGYVFVCPKHFNLGLKP